MFIVAVYKIENKQSECIRVSVYRGSKGRNPNQKTWSESVPKTFTWRPWDTMSKLYNRIDARELDSRLEWIVRDDMIITGSPCFQCNHMQIQNTLDTRNTSSTVSTPYVVLNVRIRLYFSVCIQVNTNFITTEQKKRQKKKEKKINLATSVPLPLLF